MICEFYTQVSALDMGARTYLTNGDLKNLLFREFGLTSKQLDVDTTDQNYVMMSNRSASGFAAKLSNIVFGIIGPWRSEYRDCDKFSRLFKSLSDALHARQWVADGATPNGGMAVGALRYFRGTTENHMVVVIVAKVMGKEEIRVRVFEPQNGEEIFMTPEEKRTVYKIDL